MAKSTQRRPVRNKARKRKGGKIPIAPALPPRSGNQSTSVETKDPTIELNEEPTEDQEISAEDPYIIPKLPLSALDVPGPAGELSIPALRQTKRLVHHCKYLDWSGMRWLSPNSAFFVSYMAVYWLISSDITVFAKSNCHIGSGRRFFRISLKDAALFSVNMLISAAHLDHIRRSGMSVDFFHHLGQAIGIINQRLKRGGAQSDTTIAAVACVLGLEVSSFKPMDYKVGCC